MTKKCRLFLDEEVDQNSPKPNIASSKNHTKERLNSPTKTERSQTEPSTSKEDNAKTAPETNSVETTMSPSKPEKATTKSSVISEIESDETTKSSTQSNEKSSAKPEEAKTEVASSSAKANEVDEDMEENLMCIICQELLHDCVRYWCFSFNNLQVICNLCDR